MNGCVTIEHYIVSVCVCVCVCVCELHILFLQANTAVVQRHVLTLPTMW